MWINSTPTKSEQIAVVIVLLLLDIKSSTKVLFKEKSVTWCLSNGFSGKKLSYQPNGLKFEQLSIFITSSIVWVFWGDSEVEDPSCPNFANNLQSNLKTLASICNIAWRKELVVRNHTNCAKTSRVSGLTVIPAWMIISIVMHGMKLLIHFQIYWCTEVWEWISNFIPHFTEHVIT